MERAFYHVEMAMQCASRDAYRDSRGCRRDQSRKKAGFARPRLLLDVWRAAKQR
jgi:hypothetical protein